MEESFVRVFLCLLAFLVSVVSLGAGDVGSSGVLCFLRARAFGRSSVFGGGVPFFLFFFLGDISPSILQSQKIFRLRG